MDIKFKIGDRVMYQDIGGKPLVGTITNINRNDSGEPTGYVIKLNDNSVLDCSNHQLAHLDIDKL